LSGLHFVAASVALELLVWDKDRSLSEVGSPGREGLIARGAECYEMLLYSLHAEGAGDPDDRCRAWLAESAEMRQGRGDLTTKPLFRTGRPKLSKEDLARLDRRSPQRSFTGQAEAPIDLDLVGRLERLRAFRDEGVLSEEEFALAKARLLRSD
jgi:hypothetical protein